MTTYFEEDIVSTLSPLRVYADAMPQDGTAVFPCVVYQIIPGGINIRTHSATVMRKKYVQITCWGEGANGKADCKATAHTVIEKLDLNKTNFELAVEESGGGFSVKELSPELYSTILEFSILTRKE